MADVSQELSRTKNSLHDSPNFQINQLKELGNAALQAGKFNEAIKAYSDAINLDQSNHVLFSNRSAAYLKAGRFQDALSDAEKTIQINPSWAKGYSRKGAALFALEKFDEAFTTYNKGKAKNNLKNYAN